MASLMIKELSTGERTYYGRVKRPADGKWTWHPTGVAATGKTERQIQKERDLAVAAAKKKQEQLDDVAKNPPKPAEPAPEVKLCGPLIEAWIKSLDNRGKAEDEWRARKYLLPR